MTNQEEKEEEKTEIEVWSPEDFFKTYDQMFRDFRQNILETWSSSPFTEPSYWERSVIPRVIQRPPVNLVDLGDSFELKAEVPGFEKGDIDIEVTENSITITAKKEESKETSKETYRLKEIRSRSFKRRIMFPEKVNANRGSAKIEKGILTVSVPKETPTDVEQKHKITIT
jgi:HSP20 family molecular chaperone IbpA